MFYRIQTAFTDISPSLCYALCLCELVAAKADRRYSHTEVRKSLCSSVGDGSLLSDGTVKDPFKLCKNFAITIGANWAPTKMEIKPPDFSCAEYSIDRYGVHETHFVLSFKGSTCFDPSEGYAALRGLPLTQRRLYG